MRLRLPHQFLLLAPLKNNFSIDLSSELLAKVQFFSLSTAVTKMLQRIFLAVFMNAAIAVAAVPPNSFLSKPANYENGGDPGAGKRLKTGLFRANQTKSLNSVDCLYEQLAGDQTHDLYILYL